MEAGRRLSEQEMFYARLEGKHAAIDDHEKNDYSYAHLVQRYRYNDRVLMVFIRSYHASRENYSGD